MFDKLIVEENVSDRPYCASFGGERSIPIMEREKNSYDPELFGPFIQIITEEKPPPLLL